MNCETQGLNVEGQGSCSHGRAKFWSPYLVGAGLGVLSWLVFAIVNQPLGISTAVSAASGVCATPLMGADAVKANPYWAKFPFQWDYGTLFLVGTFLGSLAAGLASRSFQWEIVPQTWRERYGASGPKRLLAAFAGGVIIIYGARMAGGCTSGHGISGSLQLAVSSWLFFLTLFAAGLVTAAFMFHKANASRAQGGTQP